MLRMLSYFIVTIIWMNKCIKTKTKQISLFCIELLAYLDADYRDPREKPVSLQIQRF